MPAACHFRDTYRSRRKQSVRAASSNGSSNATGSGRPAPLPGRRKNRLWPGRAGAPWGRPHSRCTWAVAARAAALFGEQSCASAFDQRRARWEGGRPGSWVRGWGGRGWSGCRRMLWGFVPCSRADPSAALVAAAGHVRRSSAVAAESLRSMRGLPASWGRDGAPAAAAAAAAPFRHPPPPLPFPCQPLVMSLLVSATPTLVPYRQPFQTDSRPFQADSAGGPVATARAPSAERESG